MGIAAPSCVQKSCLYAPEQPSNSRLIKYHQTLTSMHTQARGSDYTRQPGPNVPTTFMLLCRSVALGQPRKIGEGSRFNSFTTNNYKLHFYETPSGIKARRSALQWAHGSTVDSMGSAQCSNGQMMVEISCLDWLVCTGRSRGTAQELVSTAGV